MKNDGGPAFPHIYGSEYRGMSLRDWFAGKALGGYLAVSGGLDIRLPTPEKTAIDVYDYADAMLAEREKE